MVRPTQYNKIWFKEACKHEALKYNTRTMFNQSSMGAYLSAKRNGWLNEICQHMTVLRIKWSKELCKNEALKYNSRSEFARKCGGGHAFATKNKFLDEICQHMATIGSLKKRCTYAAEFDDGFVYIGLTYNFNKRTARHLVDNKSQIYKHIQVCSHKPIFKQLTKYINIEKAKQNEQYYVDNYYKNGWQVLNIAKTGAIGGCQVKWTKETCQQEALKYKTKSEFQKKSCGAHTAAYRNDWLNEICLHMTNGRKENGYWTKEMCQQEALKYKTRKEFQMKSSTSYRITRESGWLDEICKHMPKNMKNCLNIFVY
jgi:hypothetical protein